MEKYLNIQKWIGLLGLKVKDKVTGMEGIVASICFDLYGCIQACVNPGLDKEGKQKDQHWYDVNRLEVVSKKPIMNVPNYYTGPIAEGNQGAAEKPAFIKN